MKRSLGVVTGLALLALGSWIVGQQPAKSVTLPLLTGCAEASQLQACLNQLITTINGSTLGSVPSASSPRNVLDNGAFNVQQRGTGAQTCATTSAPGSSAYSADRWFCDVNVGSGAGAATVITATPAPPPGFAQSVKLVRTGGALTQPQCFWQIVPTGRAVSLQGQQVVFSAYIQALAGLAADQGTNSQTANLVVLSGTSADESASVGWTASPAITIAFTGLSTLVNASQALPSTPAWARYSATASVPAGAKELAVGICFTPTASGQSATDGIAFTGMQLEQGSVATPFEYKAPGAELAEAQRYFIRYAEGTVTAGAIFFGGGTALGTTTTCSIAIPFPVPMRVAPTYANALTNSTFKITSASQAATALSTPFSATLGANTTTNASINFTTTGMTAKDSCEIVSAAGSGNLDFISDL
jgi:hypothetical protein